MFGAPVGLVINTVVGKWRRNCLKQSCNLFQLKCTGKKTLNLQLKIIFLVCWFAEYFK